MANAAHSMTIARTPTDVRHRSEDHADGTANWDLRAAAALHVSWLLSHESKETEAQESPQGRYPNLRRARRVAIAKAKDIVRRQRDLDTCLDDDLKTILTIAQDYAAFFTEYADVFPAPPISAQQMFVEAGELAEAQAAVERERDEAGRPPSMKSTRPFASSPARRRSARSRAERSPAHACWLPVLRVETGQLRAANQTTERRTGSCELTSSTGQPGSRSPSTPRIARPALRTPPRALAGKLRTPRPSSIDRS
jgi:hypothetical protein